MPYRRDCLVWFARLPRTLRIDLFPFPLVPMYLYIYPNHHCRTVVEYTCIQLYMSLIEYPLAIVDSYVFLQ